MQLKAANIRRKDSQTEKPMDRIERLKDFLATSPHDSFLKHALALEYLKQGDVEAAKKEFEELLRENENYIGSYYHLAKIHEQANEKERAIAVYNKGMEKAKLADDDHAYRELQAAYEDLIY
jgi:tetratricopeptide (TPR) repeat protein